MQAYIMCKKNCASLEKRKIYLFIYCKEWIILQHYRSSQESIASYFNVTAHYSLHTSSHCERAWDHKEVCVWHTKKISF